MSRQPVWVGHFSTSVAIWPNWGDYNVKLMGYFTYIGYHTKNIVHIPGCPYGWALFNESCYRGRPSPHRLTYGQTVARWNFSPPCKTQNIWRKKTSSFFKDHSSRCVEEGRGAQLPTPHSASELAFIGDHFTFQHFWGPTYIFSIIPIIASFIPSSWPWSPRKLVWANWWPLSFFFSFCWSLRSFSAFFVTNIFSVILIIVSFLQVDLGRQEGWFGPKRGVYLGGRLEVSCLPIWDESRKNTMSKDPKIKNLE